MESPGAENADLDARFVYVLLKPDSVLRNQTRSLLKFFEDADLQLLDYCCGQLPMDLYGLMYADSFQWSLDHWHHNAMAYSFGPVLGLMLWSGSAGGSAVERLFVMKGSAIPRLINRETIRGRFSATDRVFNLLHIPDDTKHAVLEARHWFGDEAVAFALQRGVGRCGPPPASVYARRVALDLQAHRYLRDRELDGQTVILALKYRFMHAVQKRRIRDIALQHVLSDLATYYRSRLRGLRNDHRPRRPAEDIGAQTTASEHSCLADLMRVASTADRGPVQGEMIQLAQVLAALSDPAPTNVYALDFFWHLASTWHVYVSNLERYLATSAVMYADSYNPSKQS